jgi:dipeptidyl-peptidase-4
MKKLLFLACWAFISLPNGFSQKQSITVEDIWQKGTFRIKNVPGFNALKNGRHYVTIEGQNSKLVVRDLVDGAEVKSLFDADLYKIDNKTITIADYKLSADETKLIIGTQPQSIYRHSVKYLSYYFDTQSKALLLIDQEPILHASFNPQGSQIAYVKNNNLYIYNIADKTTQAITTDGKWNEIINGNCDWVYEEEFSFTKAYQWSPAGTYLAYYRFDESEVPLYSMSMYNSVSPQPYVFKYPRAGEPNSKLAIRIYNTLSKRTVDVDLGNETDIYIPRIKWTAQDQYLSIQRLNRHQNHLELLLADALNGKTNLIYEEKNAYYIDINDDLRFLKDGKRFLMTSERNGYNQVFIYNWQTKKLTVLTPKGYDVEKVIDVNETNGKVMYTLAFPTPLERQLFEVGFNGKGQKQITKEKGFHSITPIAGGQYFVDRYSSLNKVPSTRLKKMSGETVRVLEDNKALEEQLKNYELGTLTLVKEKGINDVLNGWMLFPPNFDSTKQYPLLMFQYSGPGSQQVADRFPIADYFWHNMLAAKGYIVACFDGTGTGFRGENFKKKTYLNLGKLESDDQIAIAKNLAKRPYVDADRIGIWGWSFGGFMSATCLMKGSDVFKMAISVAPVTNWRYYDNIYTERFMRTPQENPQGYDDNAPDHMVQNLKGDLLLIHGTGDDNVHFLNAARLVEAMVQANKTFDSEFYPDKAHGISGGKTRLHLYNRMTNFILEKL